MRLLRISVALVLVVAVLVAARAFVLDEPTALQPAIDDIDLFTVNDAQLHYCGHLRGMEPSRIPDGTRVKPVGRHGRQIVVETPSGERGLLRPSSVDRFFDVTLTGGAPLYPSERGRATVGEVPVDVPMRARNITPPEDLANLRYRVRLEDGSIVYVTQGYAVTRLYDLGIPRFETSQARLYFLSDLESGLPGEDLPAVLGRLGSPVGIKNIDGGSSKLLFSHVTALHEGMRYRGVAVEMRDEVARGVSAVGEPRRHVADGSAASRFFHGLGVSNLYVQLDWYEWWLDLPVYQAASERSRSEKWLLWIAFFGLTAAFALFLAMGFWGLPVLLTTSAAALIGRLLPISNTVLIILCHAVAALLGYLFYHFSMVFLGFGESRWITIGYAVILVWAYGLMQANVIGYINASRCPDCRNRGRTRNLGSVFKGKVKDVDWHKTVVGSSLSGNVLTVFWTWKPSVTYYHEYEDFAGCRRCGRSWSWSEITYRPRRDMAH